MTHEKEENLKRNNVIRITKKVNVADLAWSALLKFGLDFESIKIEASKHNRYKADLIINALTNVGIEVVSDDTHSARITAKDTFFDEEVSEIILRTIIPPKKKSKLE